MNGNGRTEATHANCASPLLVCMACNEALSSGGQWSVDGARLLVMLHYFQHLILCPHKTRLFAALRVTFPHVTDHQSLVVLTTDHSSNSYSALSNVLRTAARSALSTRQTQWRSLKKATIATAIRIIAAVATQKPSGLPRSGKMSKFMP